MLTTTWGEALDREHPLQEYPRPQLRRESYLNLNGPWEYAFTRENMEPEEYDGEIIVPFAPESELSGVGRTLRPGEYLWYHRSLTLPEGFHRGRVILHFGAVDQTARVWVNGVDACAHTGGYLSYMGQCGTFWSAMTYNNVSVRGMKIEPSGKTYVNTNVKFNAAYGQSVRCVKE